jgi:outer membrane cobalamin receptor
MSVSRGFSILFFSFLLPSLASGQEKDLWNIPIEDLLRVKVVSATRKEDSSLPLPMVVTRISSEELGRWGAENLADGLRQAAGMQIRKSGGDFPLYQATVRGNFADFLNTRTLFLIDGIPVRNPNGGFDPSWIPISIIDRVEIVKGPASGLYGANAFGGVVNIITKSGKNFQGTSVGLSYRLQNDHIENKEIPGRSGAVSLGVVNDSWDYFATAQVTGTNNTGTTYIGQQSTDVFAKAKHQISDRASLSLQSLVSLDNYQLALTNADLPMKNDFVNVMASYDSKVGADSDLNLTAHFNNFRHFANYTDSLTKYENKGQVYGLHSQLTTPLEGQHIVTTGLDYSALSGSLETYANDYSTFPPTVKSAGWDNDRQNEYGIYTQYEYLGWHQFRPLLGVRYDHNSVFGGALSPRFGISYLLDSQTTLYASIGSGFRAPTFNETRIQGFGKLGNPDLVPELATTYEIGIKSIQEKIQNTVSLFKQDVTRKIQLNYVDPNNTSGLQTYRNTGTAEILGLEIDGAYKPLSRLRLFYNAIFLRSDDGQGKRIERLIERKMVLGASWAISMWSFELIATNESDQFFYNTNPAIQSDSEGRVFLPSLTTANFQTSYTFGEQKTLTLFINNITDQKYKESFSPFIEQNAAWMPGRTLGLTFNSKF